MAGQRSASLVWQTFGLLVIFACYAFAGDTYDSTLKGAGTTATAAIKMNFEDKLLAKDYFDYSVRIDGSIPGLQSITLNQGKNGQTGPVVANLFGPQPASAAPATGNVISGRITRDRLVGPFAGRSIDDLEDAVDNESIYGLVTFTGGAIRGYFDD